MPGLEDPQGFANNVVHMLELKMRELKLLGELLLSVEKQFGYDFTDQKMKLNRTPASPFNFRIEEAKAKAWCKRHNEKLPLKERKNPLLFAKRYDEWHSGPWWKGPIFPVEKPTVTAVQETPPA